jgi:hypothetical protein
LRGHTATPPPSCTPLEAAPMPSHLHAWIGNAGLRHVILPGRAPVDQRIGRGSPARGLLSGPRRQLHRSNPCC